LLSSQVRLRCFLFGSGQSSHLPQQGDAFAGRFLATASRHGDPFCSPPFPERVSTGAGIDVARPSSDSHHSAGRELDQGLSNGILLHGGGREKNRAIGWSAYGILQGTFAEFFLSTFL